MILYITQKDFDAGVQANCCLCPVGISANRAAKKLGYRQASVGADTINFETRLPSLANCVRHFSYDVRQFIRDFDQGKIHTFKPFSFTILDIPDLTAGNPG